MSILLLTVGWSEYVQVTGTRKVYTLGRPQNLNYVWTRGSREQGLQLAPSVVQQLHYISCSQCLPFPAVLLYKCKQNQAAIS